jgi:hypothetical protein
MAKLRSPAESAGAPLISTVSLSPRPLLAANAPLRVNGDVSVNDPDLKK